MRVYNQYSRGAGKTSERKNRLVEISGGLLLLFLIFIAGLFIGGIFASGGPYKNLFLVDPFNVNVKGYFLTQEFVGIIESVGADQLAVKVGDETVVVSINQPITLLDCGGNFEELNCEYSPSTTLDDLQNKQVLIRATRTANGYEITGIWY
ncbi:MAG: hypothetical protein HYT70_03160 [Candidatus Aenigmarchaeota archaeon]|nr:hypothetical protein [Candidatus Aenigmarchaeota archaeon]